jgi:hypothetical protein
MPVQTRVGKILGPYKRRKLDRAPIQPYARGPNTDRRITAIRQLKSAMGIEPKYFDVTVGAAFTAGLAFSNLTASLYNPQILLGDEVYQRNGRKITLNRVTFRGSIFTTPTTAQTSVSPSIVCRVFLWRNDVPGVPNNIVAMADGTAFPNTPAALGGFQSPNANGYGKIVDDQTVVLSPTAAVNNNGATTVSTAATEVPIMLSYSPKKPMTLNYQAAAVSPDPDKYFTIYGLADSLTYAPSLNGIMRFYYTDA